MRRNILIFAVMLFCMLSVLDVHAFAQASGNHLLSLSASTSSNPLPSQTSSSTPTTSVPDTTSLACTTINISQTDISTGINTGIGLSILALLVSISVIAMGYMISKLLPASGLGRWIDQEIYEAAKTAILIVGIYALLSLLGSVAVILSGQTPVSSSAGNFNILANGANSYLCQVQDNVANNFDFLITVTNDIGLLQSVKVYYALAIPTPWQLVYESVISFNPYAATLFLNVKAIINNPFAYLLNELLIVVSLPVIYIINLESFILPYMVILGLAILIPMGLVFRAFPFIRGIGGTLIAIGIGIAIIYPAILVIFNQNVSNVVGPALLQVPNAVYASTGNWFFDGLIDVFNNVLRQVLSNLIAWNAVLTSMVNIYTMINVVMGYNIYVIIQFLLFILDLAITVPVVRAIATALGGSVRLSLGKRMKLV